MPLIYLVAAIILLSSYAVSSSSDLALYIVRHEIKGRAEIFHNGSWGTICDDSWSDVDAGIFCKMLGYSVGVSVTNSYTKDGAGIIMLDDVGCSGTESSLNTCSHREWGTSDCSHSEDTGVNCTSPLFRISGHPAKGMAQMYYNNVWRNISATYWDDNDAKVFCKSIGYRFGKLSINSQYVNGIILRSNMQCRGNEDNIMICAHSTWQVINIGRTYALSVDCEEARVRVVEDYIYGRAEIFHNNIWGTICDDSWTDQASKVFCRNMGYSGGTSRINTVTEDGTGNIWLDDVQCLGREMKIIDCRHTSLGTHNCGHSEDTGVNCTVAAKRVHSDGYAEVFYQGEWGRICDDFWGMNNSVVFCQELGYTSGMPLKGLRPANSIKTWLQNVQCSGKESYIEECDHSQWGQQTCTYGTHVRLHCLQDTLYTTQQINVSLSEDAQGTANITVNGIRVMLTSNSISISLAEALCKRNGYSVGSTLEYVQVQVSGKLLCTDFIHVLNGTWSIYYKPCGSGSATAPYIRCGNEIYRVTGKDKYEGRLEVNINGVWGNLCSTSWNNTGAKLACNALGFQEGVSVPGSNFNSALTKSWMRNIDCTMQSKSISDCQHILVEQDICPSSELIGVRCFNVKVRLDSSSSSYKSVQVLYNGNWGYIRSNNFNNQNTQVICKMLGFTRGALSYNYDSSNKIFVINSVNCHGNESMITECANIQWTHITSTEQSMAVQCLTDVRFHNGRTHNGVIEILKDNEWGGICGKAWTSNDATVACRSMGYVSGLVSVNKQHIREKGFLSDMNCQGTEDNLINCPHGSWGYHRCNKWAAAECSKYKVRLRGGKSPNEGRVEIFQHGVWGTVCDKDWNHESASVICRSLGYNQGIKYDGWKFGQGKGPILFDQVNCNGDEPFIDHCDAKDWSDKMVCNHSHDAGVVCLENGVRLVDGITEKEGRVEVFQTHRWGSLCSDYWNNNNAMVVCRMLGYMYGSGYQIPKTIGFTQNISPLLIQSPLNCSGNESSVFDCPRLASKRCHFIGAQVACGNVGVRFVDKISDNAGSIQVLIESEWRSICPSSWDEKAATTVCNMLGFVDGFALFKQKTPPVPRFITDLKCKGNEHSIDECSYHLTGPKSCYTSDSVGVFCSMVDMRISNTVPGIPIGHLEILYRGIWGTVCNMSWSNMNALVVCRSLGYRQGTVVPNYRLPVIADKRHQSWIDNVQCDGNESSLLTCKHGDFGSAFCRADHFASVNCTDFVGIRLEDGRNSSEGRVEVIYKGVWGTVCFEEWDDVSATVACKMLGYRIGIATETDIFVPSNKQIWLNLVKCRGDETSLQDCPHSPWRWNHCSHRREAGVICHNGTPPSRPNTNTIIG